jgi:hypothetical protein
MLFSAMLIGCGDRRPTAEEALKEQLKVNLGYNPPEAAAKCAGRVTVDSLPPKSDCTLFVLLHRPDHLDEAAHMRGKGYQLFVPCDTEGHFEFRNGVQPGKYVITFVELHPRGSPTARGGGRARMLHGSVSPRQYTQPDELKNLYNDPDKNIKDPRFNLNVELPGKDDYQFDLTVAGKEAIENPGPNAIAGAR